MTNFLRSFVVCALIINCTVNVCMKAEEPSNRVDDKLKRYETANPAADLQTALSKRDMRFLAVRGFTLTVPGVDDYQTKYASRYPNRILEGTSEFVGDERGLRLQARARQYAAAYNTLLLKHILQEDSAGSGGSDSRIRETLANLRKLAASDPERDFRVAKENGDIHFLAMMGYSGFVPGVPEYDKKYSAIVKAKIIPGTTDAITSPEQDQLLEAVKAYAQKYNKLVLNYLAKNPQKPRR
jgi:hypothetical protein